MAAASQMLGGILALVWFPLLELQARLCSAESGPALQRKAETAALAAPLSFV